MTSSFNPGGGGGQTGETVQFGADGFVVTGSYNGEILQATASGGVITFDAPTAADQAVWMTVDPNSFTYSVSLGTTAEWASGGTPSYSTTSVDQYLCVPAYGLGKWVLLPSAQVLSGYLVAANNLSDVASPATALANLGGTPIGNTVAATLATLVTGSGSNENILSMTIAAAGTYNVLAVIEYVNSAGSVAATWWIGPTAGSPTGAYVSITPQVLGYGTFQIIVYAPKVTVTAGQTISLGFNSGTTVTIPANATFMTATLA